MTLGRHNAWMLAGTAALVLLALPSVHAQGRGAGGGRPGGMPGGRTGFGGPPGGGHEIGRGGNNNGPSMNAPRTDSGNFSHSSVRLGPPGRWWDNSGFAQSVGLRKDQRKKMDSIFDSNKHALLESYQTLQREENKLANISKQSQPDKAQLFAAIDSVNQARASLEKVTTQMLLQIRQQMDPDQLTRIDALREAQQPQ